MDCGHSQPNCNAPYRCMKCAEPHSTHECPKPKTTPPLCANCNSPHVSTYHSCPMNPVNLKKTYSGATKSSQPQTTSQPTTSHPRPPLLPTPSQPKDNTYTNNPYSDPFATAMYPIFQLFTSSNPTQEKLVEFSRQVLILRNTMNS